MFQAASDEEEALVCTDIEEGRCLGETGCGSVHLTKTGEVGNIGSYGHPEVCRRRCVHLLRQGLVSVGFDAAECMKLKFLAAPKSGTASSNCNFTRQSSFTKQHCNVMSTVQSHHPLYMLFVFAMSCESNPRVLDPWCGPSIQGLLPKRC